MRIVLVIWFLILFYATSICQPQAIDIIKDAPEKLLPSIENAYHYSPSLKKVMDHLHESEVEIQILYVMMDDIEHGYYVEDSKKKGTVYLNEKLDFNILHFAEVLYQSYETVLYGKSYLHSRLSKIEGMIFSHVIASELDEKSTTFLSLNGAKDKESKKFTSHLKKLIQKGYSDDTLLYLVENSDILPIFETKNNRYLIKNEKIEANTISAFLK